MFKSNDLFQNFLNSFYFTSQDIMISVTDSKTFVWGGSVCINVGPINISISRWLSFPQPATFLPLQVTFSSPLEIEVSLKFEAVAWGKTIPLMDHW